MGRPRGKGFGVCWRVAAAHLRCRRRGRISILGARDSLEWITPILYVRAMTTKLFSLTHLRQL